MKQIKDMTTAEWRKAWTEIAIAFEAEPVDRSDWQSTCTTHGLCVAFRNHCERELGDWQRSPIWETEICNLLDQLHKADGEWFHTRRELSWTRKCDLVRSTFAAMFAAMTPKEFLAICEAPR